MHDSLLFVLVIMIKIFFPVAIYFFTPQLESIVLTLLDSGGDDEIVDNEHQFHHHHDHHHHHKYHQKNSF